MTHTFEIGILTFDGAKLGDKHLQSLSIDPSRCYIQGAPDNGALQRHIRHGDIYLHDDISQELVAAAQDMLKAAPEIASVILECTNMPPFAEAIQAAIGLPVYDVHTAGMWFYSALVNSRPRAWGTAPEDSHSTRM